MEYRVDAIRSFKELKIRKDEWISFEKKIKNIQLSYTYNYLSIFWQSYSNARKRELGLQRKLLVLFLYENNSLIAIYPLCKIIYRRKKILKVSAIEFISQQIAPMYLDIICDNLKDEAHLFIFNWLYQNEKFHYIFFSQIPGFTVNKNSIFYKYLYSFSYCTEADFGNIQKYDEYKKNNYPKKIRDKLNLCRNRIEKAGYKMNFIFKDFVIDDLEELERIANYKENQVKAIKNIYSDEYKKNFLKEIYHSFETKICYLQLDLKNIAFITFIRFNNKIFLYDTAYDTAYQQFSPGILSFNACIEENINEGVKSSNFGWGGDFYKFRLGNTFIPLNRSITIGNKIFSFLWFKERLKMIKQDKLFFEETTNLLKEATTHLDRNKT